MRREESLIKGALSLLLVSLEILLAITILGCSTVSPKIERAIVPDVPCREVNVELWRIDPQALELYRMLDTGQEESLKIQGSKLMHEFVVMDIEEYGRLIEAFFKECRRVE